MDSWWLIGILFLVFCLSWYSFSLVLFDSECYRKLLDICTVCLSVRPSCDPCGGGCCCGVHIDVNGMGSSMEEEERGRMRRHGVTMKYLWEMGKSTAQWHWIVVALTSHGDPASRCIVAISARLLLRISDFDCVHAMDWLTDWLNLYATGFSWSGQSIYCYLCRQPARNGTA